MKKFIFILSLFPFITTQACEDVNLYELNPRLSETKIVNQGNMSTCYAHTLGALYSVEKSNNLADSLHPYWVAFNHKQRFVHWSPRNLNYSLLSWAYNDIEKNGICPYNEVEAQLTKLKSGVPYSNDQVLFAIRTFFTKKLLHPIKKEATFQKVIDSTLKELTEKQNKFEIAWTRNDLVKILAPIKDKMAGQEFFNFLSKNVFMNCKSLGQPVGEKLSNFGRSMESNEYVRLKMADVLAHGKSIAVGYCPNRIYKRDPASTKDINMLPRLARSFNTDCGAHYSMLVGSRKAGNSCQYLLRNSYGTGFWGHESMECYCEDMSTREHRNCSKSENNPNLKVLGCWVDAAKMANNTYDASYFE